MMNLDKKKKYVVACSFGPDSMALLNMLLQEEYDVVVAHVNYHKRKESDYEERSLKEYCLNKNVPTFVLDTNRIEHVGNFQDWARKIRYEFFKEVLNKNKCDAVLVAHQQDDLIETYLMQKSKKSFVNYYGIEKETVLFGVKIIRPLLGFTKRELEKYDAENGVPYSVDWTNLTNLYTRNKYRHEFVEKMSLEERKNIIKEIDNLNKNNQRKNNIDLNKNIWDLREFLNETNINLVLQISNNLQKRGIFKKIGQNSIESVKNAFRSEHSNVLHKLVKNIHLIKSYSRVYLVDLDQFFSYDYVIEKPGKYSFEFIEFDFADNDNDRNINSSDFPIRIKPVSGSETYRVSEYNCQARRLFIDWKMPRFLRGWWPGIYNKNGQLIYIPRYRETYTDNHTSKLIIKFPQF